MLAELAQAQPELVRAKLREYGLADTKVNRAVAAEEVLAELAQAQPVVSIRGDEIAPLDVEDIKVLRESARQWYSEHLRGRKVANLGSGRAVEFRGAR